MPLEGALEGCADPALAGRRRRRCTDEHARRRRQRRALALASTWVMRSATSRQPWRKTGADSKLRSVCRRSTCRQVHGARVVRLAAADTRRGEAIEADAAITTAPGVACTVQVADCLPVLFAAPDGRGVGAAHAGWRGLAGGVLEATVTALCAAAACEPQSLVAWLGPCIGPRQFEVGAEVVAALRRRSAFRAAAARRRLDALAGRSARPRARPTARPQASCRSAAAPGARSRTRHGSSRFAATASPGAWPPLSGCSADASAARRARRRAGVPPMYSTIASGSMP